MFDGGGGLDQTDYTCEYKLKNLTDEEQNIRVGFPLTSDLLGDQKLKSEEANKLVLRYDFIVRDRQTTYHVEYGHRPDEDDTPHMFVWRMTFQPGETRHLTVSYNLPISALVGDTWKQNADRDGFDNPWFRRFSGAMIEMFSYITVTGKTWARNIENATFRLKPEGFEQYLSRRPMDETASPESGSRNEWKKRVVPHVHREVTPKNYEQKDGDLVWTYDDFTPGPTIRVKYFLIAIPSRLRDWKGYFEHSDESLSETDAEIITGFYKALHGIPPSNDMVKSFVQQQVWYEKKPKEERSLDESQQEIIDFILKHVKDQ